MTCPSTIGRRTQCRLEEHEIKPTYWTATFWRLFRPRTSLPDTGPHLHRGVGHLQAWSGCKDPVLRTDGTPSAVLEESSGRPGITAMGSFSPGPVLSHCSLSSPLNTAIARARGVGAPGCWKHVENMSSPLARRQSQGSLKIDHSPDIRIPNSQVHPRIGVITAFDKGFRLLEGPARGTLSPKPGTGSSLSFLQIQGQLVAKSHFESCAAWCVVCRFV